MAKVKRSAYRPHDRVVFHSSRPGRTRQEFAQECDINVIMRRYAKSGVLPGTQRPLKYGDFSEVPDFMTAMNVINEAAAAFAALPALVRRRFDNDPGEFIQFVQNPENLEECRRLGLAEVPQAPPKTPEAPPPVVAAPPPTEAPKAS